MKRKIHTLYLIIASFFILTEAYSAVPVKPLPSWVAIQSFQNRGEFLPDSTNNGYYILLNDYQYNVAKQEFYYHEAYKIISDAGVQNASQFGIEYDPSFQKVALHRLLIYRDHKIINELQNAKISELQQEKDLDEFIYNGSKTVNVLLNDVRAGDIVEYDYSIVGFNPIFGDKFFTDIYVNSESDLQHFYCRILMPSERHLNIKMFNSHLTPEISQTSSNTEYIWQEDHPKKISYNENVPNGYLPYEIIEVSEYNSWKEIQDLYSGFFNLNQVSSKTADSLINAINSESGYDENKIMKAVRFVQDKIRYLGVEMGENSNKPFPPEVTLQRRFGDCKDKSLLLAYLLKKLGFDAYPALVNGGLGNYIDSILPMPACFDHAIVYLNFHGRDYWIDATSTYERGNLDLLCTPSYSGSLVIDGKSDQLITINSFSSSKTVVHDTIEVQNFSGDANFKVTTQYSGWSAIENRSSFAQNSLEDIQNDYVKYYKQKNLNVESKTKLSFTDDTDNNTFTTYEEYKISKIWIADSSRLSIIKFTFEPLIVEHTLSEMNDPGRSAPLAVNYPSDITEDIIAEMPSEWPVSPKNHHIINDYFDCVSSTTSNGADVHIYWELKTKKDAIPLKDVDSVSHAIHEIYDRIAYSFTYNTSVNSLNLQGGASDINWMLLFIFIATLAACSYFSRRYYLHGKKEIPVEPSTEYLFPEPIRGWIILPIIGLFLSPLIIFITVISNGTFSYAGWITLTTPSHPFFHPFWAPILLIEACVNAFIIVFPVLLLILIFKRDHRLPGLMIFFYLFVLCFHMFDTIAIQYMPQITSSISSTAEQGLTRSIIGCAIWIPYFKYSQRVKLIFVR